MFRTDRGLAMKKLYPFVTSHDKQVLWCNHHKLLFKENIHVKILVD